MKVETSKIMIDQIEHEIFKIPLFEKEFPHIFIQNALFDSRFRFSTNYKKLNKDFGIKIEIYRDIANIKNELKNSLFDLIVDDNKNLFYKFKPIFKEFNINFYYQNLSRVKIIENNNITIEKLRIQETEGDKVINTTIILITKNYNENNREKISQGIFFSSDSYYDIYNIDFKKLNQKIITTHHTTNNNTPKKSKVLD